MEGWPVLKRTFSSLRASFPFDVAPVVPIFVGWGLGLLVARELVACIPPLLAALIFWILDAGILYSISTFGSVPIIVHMPACKDRICPT